MIYKLLEQAKPILFNTEMVQAILDGRKTVTRRVAKVPNESFYRQGGLVWYDPMQNQETKKCPKYKVGDYLYVRETWQFEGQTTSYDNNGDIIHQEKYYNYKVDNFGHVGNWKPSLFMPKEAARILLRVTDVRVERLQEITHSGIAKEGIKSKPIGNLERINPFYVFSHLWDSTIKKQDLDKYGWNANPWVFVYEFERVIDDE